MKTEQVKAFKNLTSKDKDGPKGNGIENYKTLLKQFDQSYKDVVKSITDDKK
jgi:hypothetical protein